MPSSPAATLRRALLAGVALATMGAGFAEPAAARADQRGDIAAYLSARVAELRNDVASAALFYGRAAEAAPEDSRIANQALRYALFAGDVEAAARYAAQLSAAGESGVFIDLLTAVKAFMAEDAAEALARAAALEKTAPVRVAALMSGWASAALQDDADAAAAFTRLGEPAAVDPSQGVARADLAALFGAYHQALLDDLRGRSAEAAVVLQALVDAPASKDAPDPWRQRVALAAAGALARSGDRAEAEAVLKAAIAAATEAPRLARALAALQAGGDIPLVVASTRDGAAEALYTLSGVFGEIERLGAPSLIYANLALALAPGLEEARLLVGELEIALQQHQAAAATFARIDAASPYLDDARMGAVRALQGGGDREAALAALEAYIASFETPATSLLLYRAGMLQSLARFEDCAAAFDAALARVEAEEGGFREEHWRDLFGHGVCLERTGRWEAAEARLRQALEMQPGQPQLLNYLGYSLLEQKRSLEEALELIRRAVAAAPESGHIVDSLGWALYRLGRYAEAVPELEKAAALEPTIAIINDHLGDALWRVGRRMEARFQWSRALSFESEADDEIDRDRIRAKLERGLDAVLEEEQSAERPTRPNGG